jgi:hypothetical protein
MFFIFLLSLSYQSRAFFIALRVWYCIFPFPLSVIGVHQHGKTKKCVWREYMLITNRIAGEEMASSSSPSKFICCRLSIQQYCIGAMACLFTLHTHFSNLSSHSSCSRHIWSTILSCRQDSFAWNLTQSRLFSFKSMYLDLMNVKGICPRGNNKVVIIVFHIYDKCLFLMLELY